jgi:thymidylate synthase
MKYFEFKNVNQMYKKLSKLLFREKLTGNTKELNNVVFTIKDVTDPIINIRDMSISYLCGELMWYFCGSNDVHFISKFAKRWSEITDDGTTSNSAYGHIIAKRHGFNQFETVTELLKKDLLSRRAVINFNVPNKNVIDTKDEICTICLQFLIRENKLDCTAMMRSNDIVFGTPYDIAFFVSLQKNMAKELGIECGKYTHFATSIHLYQKDELMLKHKLKRKVHENVKLNSEKLSELTVQDYERISNSTSPRREVVELFVEKGIITL